MGETTQGRTGKWATRPGGETTRGDMESGRNDSGVNGKVGVALLFYDLFPFGVMVRMLHKDMSCGDRTTSPCTLILCCFFFVFFFLFF